MDPTLLIDGCDNAIVGLACRCGQVPVVVYDRNLLVDCFVAQGMTLEEADEWVSFNIDGAWAGEGTPMIMLAGGPEETKERLEEMT